MTAIDTNVLLRDIVRDDRAQAEAAKQIIESGDILIVSTVFLEFEWVLRSVYKWSRARVNTVLTAVINVENIVTDDDAGIRWAILRHSEGADFADMLHIARAQSAARFVTFDRRVKQYAGDETGVLIETIAAA